MDDIVHFLRYHDGFAEIFPHRFVEVFDVIRHICRCNRLPRFLDGDYFAYALQPPHFVDKYFHNDDGGNREQDFVVFDGIYFKHDKTFGEQIQFLVRIEQEIVFAPFVIRFEHVEKSGNVKIFFADFFGFQHVPVPAFHVFVKGIETGFDASVRFDFFDVKGNGIGQGDLLRARRRFVVPFPEGHNQRFDAFPFFHVVHEIFGVERIERDGIFIGVSVVNSVFAFGFLMNEIAQSLVRITRIHHQHVRSLFVVLPYEVVHKEGFAASRRTEDELIPVGDDSFFHRQVGNIQMQRFSREPVRHFDAEGRRRTSVVGFLIEKAQGRFNKRVETFFRGKIGCIARHARPVERCRIHRVVAGSAFHQR